MLWPLALIVVVWAAYQAGRTSTPSTGAIVGALPPPEPGASLARSGVVRLELGAPYVINAELERIPTREEVSRLAQLLGLGPYRAELARSKCGSSPAFQVRFRAPKTERLPLGRLVDWDLGDGKARVLIRAIERLDRRPIALFDELGEAR